MPARNFAHSSRDSGSNVNEPDSADLSVASRNERAAIYKISIDFDLTLKSWSVLQKRITWPGDGGSVVRTG